MTRKRTEPRAGDAAGVGPYARERADLVPLSEMRGWNVTKDEVDIRSWEIKTVSGRVLGSVRELLVDPKAGEVVMIDMDLAGTPDHAYVPLRIVEIDRSRRVVRADSGDIEPASAGDTEVERTSTPIADSGSVRYANEGGERVIDRRPIVEETVVRRREPDNADERI